MLSGVADWLGLSIDCPGRGSCRSSRLSCRIRDEGLLDSQNGPEFQEVLIGLPLVPDKSVGCNKMFWLDEALRHI